MSAEPAAQPLSRDPRVWVLVGDRPGDNRQGLSLAEALGWPTEQKYLRVRPEFATSKPRVLPTLAHLDPAQSCPLKPPWPDLVISMGRRLSMAALWIGEHSGGATKLVLLGKASGRLDDFDLVVTSVENPLPRRPNVLQVDLPLSRIDETELKKAELAWAPRLATLRRPVVALLVGGPTRPYPFRAYEAERMIRRVVRLADEQHASLFVVTSPRTPPHFVPVLAGALRDGDQLAPWSPDPGENPYLALLGVADSFVVTADSVSMLVDVARLGGALAVYPLEAEPPRSWKRLKRALAARILSSSADDAALPLLEPLGYALYRTGWLRHPRRLDAVHDALIGLGVAVPFGAPLPKETRGAPDELERVTSRIREMMREARE